jgi:hypothetical protein
MNLKRSQPVLCPSGQAGMAGGMAFGVIGGTEGEPRVRWIERPVPVTEELLALTAPVPPTQVLRIAAPCQEQACCHFDGTDCRLATRLVQLMPSVAATLPPCRIRPDCRWHLQEGAAACARCPQIVTYSINPTPELSRAATPDGNI